MIGRCLGSSALRDARCAARLERPSPTVLRWGAFARLVVCRSLLAKTELASPGLHE